MSTPVASRIETLRTSAHSFCQSLLSPLEPATLLEKYFTSKPRITEHGPLWAASRLPFLGKTFAGKDGCNQYFTLLSQTLKMYLTEETFPSIEGFIVDPEATPAPTFDFHSGKGAVSVVGKASFESIKTGKGWQEQFIYRLSDFDETGRFGHWEIWADPLSAWDAVGEI